MEEFSLVVLRRDLPAHGLSAGEVGTIVLAYGDGEAYEVEFVRTAGERPALLTLTTNEIGPAAGRLVSARRPIPRS
jgi:hypothetical protein